MIKNILNSIKSIYYDFCFGPTGVPHSDGVLELQDPNLLKTIAAHEGCRQFAYEDSLGYWTIGIGRNIDKRNGRGLSEDEAHYLLDNDIHECEQKLYGYYFYQIQDQVRKGVLIELVFNMGMSGVLEFKEMIQALSERNYIAANDALIHSKWATEVGDDRKKNISFRLIRGEYP